MYFSYYFRKRGYYYKKSKDIVKVVEDYKGYL